MPVALYLATVIQSKIKAKRFFRTSYFMPQVISRTAIALIQGGEEHLFSGEVRGTITTEPLGNKGFGYDPVFIPEDTGLTFAQLGEDVKNHISHRARAVAKLTEFLNK